VFPSHTSLPPALWTTSWLLLAPHHRRQTFSHRDVSLGEETSGNRWARDPDCTADGPIYPTGIFPEAQWWRARKGAFGGILDRCCHFKHVSFKQSRFYHCQTSTAHRHRIKVDGSVAIMRIKNFPIGLHVMYLYFPDTPVNHILTVGSDPIAETWRVVINTADGYRSSVVRGILSVCLYRHGTSEHWDTSDFW